MKTKQKIFFAKIIYKILSKILKKEKFIIKRKGINWSLNLSEAIDLHILIFGNFEPEIKNVARKLKFKKNNIIIDIGANFGVQTLQFSKSFLILKFFH